MKAKSLRMSLLLSSALVPVFAQAASADDQIAQSLTAQSQISQGAPGAGSFPNSILIPGSNTSFGVGGYIKGDYTYDFSAHQDFVGTNSTALSPGAIPLDNNGGAARGTAPSQGHSVHGASRFSASESRFHIETRTPTAYGELKTFMEGDFTGPSGLTPGSGFEVNSDSSGFRLRYAYGTLGPWLVGQINSLFRDSNAEPETLDFGGAIGAGPLRQPQFRYTYDAGNGLLLAISAENPQTQVIDATTFTPGVGGAVGTPATNTPFGVNRADKIPDFVGATTWNQPWGHLTFRAVARDLYDHDGGASGAAKGTGIAVSNFGWGLGFAGDVKTWGKDDVIFQINGGDGIGRYSNNIGLTADAAVNPKTNQIENLKIVSALLGYQHWWTDELRSTAVASYLHVDNPQSFFVTPAAFAVQANNFDTVHVNLVWSPVPQVDTGIEYIHENRTIEDGQSGDANRVQVSTKFKF